MRQPKYQRDGDSRTSGPGFALSIHPDTLDIPRSWNAPRVIFVNSMSDLFHPSVPLGYIRDVFDVIEDTPQHTYQVLTKRSKRLAELSDRLRWPANLWMGVSVESMRYSFRIDHLRDVDPAVRFVSAEPLLAPLPTLDLTGIHWLIAGGESGPNARPMDRLVGGEPTRPMRALPAFPSSSSSGVDARQRPAAENSTANSTTGCRSSSRSRDVTRYWGFWTRGKLELLRRYLDAFTTTTKNKATERLYLDIFGGQPENRDRLTYDLLDGSARIALSIDDPPFTRLRFLELDPYATRLRTALEQDFSGRDFEVIAGDCNTTIHTTLQELAHLSWAPTFAFVDPNGPDTHWSSIEALANFKRKDRPKAESLASTRRGNVHPDAPD